MTSAAATPADTFAPYTNDVYRWAYRLLGQHHDALDVVQDVFLRWNKQCATEPPDQPRGWLRRATINRAIDFHRQRRLDDRHTQDAGKHERSAAGIASCQAAEPSIAHDLDRHALRNDIATALDDLTDAQRTVLVAKVFDEMTFAGIATELGLSASTIKTHYLRAVRSLRDDLRGRWLCES